MLRISGPEVVLHNYRFDTGIPFYDGAGSRIRTDDLLITNQLLYQLSYAGVYLAKSTEKTCLSPANSNWPRSYFPGGRYLTVFFVAWSTSSGLISTVARDSARPLALTANERAAASTLLGRSAIITKSLLPKA